MIRGTFQTTGLILLWLCGSCGTSLDSDTPAAWPIQGEWTGDLILVSVDTMRADRLSLYGGDRDTDGLATQFGTPAWLASQGTTFEQAWAPIGKTLPALGTFWTGLDPLEHGGVSNKHAVLAPSRMRTYAEQGALGLAMVANRSLGPASGLAQGFAGYAMRWGAQEKEIASEMTRRTRDAISGKKRLVLWAHFMAPHQPYDPPEAEAARYQVGGTPGSNALLASIHRDPASLSMNEKHRLRALYDAEIHMTSTRVAELLAGLDANYRAAGRGGLLENARVVFFSDHGEELADHHGYFMHAKSLYSGVIRVPLILAGPGIPSSARESQSLGLGDILPLVIHGTAPKGGVQCASWQGQFFAARDDRWTLIHNPTLDRNGPLEPPEDVAFFYPAVALFDREADHAELQDVAAQYPEVTRRLLRELRLWWAGLNPASPGIPEGVDPALLAELGYSDSFENQMTEPWLPEQWNP